MKIKQTRFLKSFVCLADKCPDTCCQGWSMQVDSRTKSLYQEKAPELLAATEMDGGLLAMKRHKENDYCVKFDNGLCSIQKSRGSDFLTDACHFYPRTTRKFGPEIFMTASLSCPEIARLALTGNKEAFVFDEVELERLPGIKDYLADKELQPSDARKVIQHFMELCDDENVKPERIISRLVSLGGSFNLLARKDWPEAIEFMARTVDSRLSPPETHSSDPYNLVNILAGLLHSSGKKRPQLEALIEGIKQALGVRINPVTFAVEEVKKVDYKLLEKEFNDEFSAKLASVFKNWIRAQISISAFPFSGFGNNPLERAIIIAVRFATLKLSCMANMPQLSSDLEKTFISLAQTLARFMDHLADPTVSLSCYQEAGWLDQGRIRGLLGDGL